VARLREDGPTPREDDRARNQIETQFWRGLEGLAERADLLNRYQFHLGDPGGLARDRERYTKVTQETAKEWARKALPSEGRLFLRVVPRGAGEGTGAAPTGQAAPGGKE
jgi:predicted Zn-dependent peptidase